MKPKILTCLKKPYYNKKNIFGFDVETEQEECYQDDLHYIKQSFLCGALTYKDRSWFFRDKKEMQKFLLSRTCRNGIIFATNLDFDFNILYDDELYHISPLERNGDFIICKKSNGKDNWKFLDTMNYIPLGVKKLGAMLGYDKLMYDDFSKKPETYDEWQEIKEYNIRDAFISQKGGEFIQSFCNSFKMRMKDTLASQGIEFLRRRHLKSDIFQEPRFMINKHFEGSIKGGRTEVIKRGYFKELYYYDYNSHYPATCFNGIDGSGSYPNPSTAEYLKNGSLHYIETYEGISRVVIHAPDMYIPLLGIKDELGKLIFPTGKLKQWYTHIELRKALELGYVISEIYETIYYRETFVPFRECVKELYDLRLSYKKEGNEPMQRMIKTLMNGGLFGKFAQKIDNKTQVHLLNDLCSDDFGRTFIYAKNGKKKYLDQFLIRGNYAFETIPTPRKIPVYILPILSSYTTAMARIKLHENINKYAEFVSYCDTDSLMMTKACYNSTLKLGGLKLECVMKDAIIVKPKQYCYMLDGKDKIAFKGAKLSNRSDFIDILNGKTTKMTRFTGVKESAIRKVPYGSIIEIQKNISIEDTKRKWKHAFDRTKNEDSLPLSL